MIWQDAVFAIGSVIFALALIPSVRSRTKPARATSALTAAVLTVYVLTFATLGLWYSSTTGAITAAMWWLLWWQAQRQYLALRRRLDFVQPFIPLNESRYGVLANGVYVPNGYVYVVGRDGQVIRKLAANTRDVTR